MTFYIVENEFGESNGYFTNIEAACKFAEQMRSLYKKNVWTVKVFNVNEGVN